MFGENSPGFSSGPAFLKDEHIINIQGYPVRFFSCNCSRLTSLKKFRFGCEVEVPGKDSPVVFEVLRGFGEVKGFWGGS